MGLQILHGTQPGDLVDFCMNKICKEARLWPQKRAFLIVPEQTKADMERRYLEVMRQSGGQDRAEGLMLVDVLSFNRFSHRILSEVGGLAEDSLDAPMSSLIIHRVLSEEKNRFKVLSHFADRFGFASDLEKILGDFYRYEISSEMLRSASFSNVAKSFSDKMDDFAFLMDRVDHLVDNLGYCNKISPMQRLSFTLDMLKQTERDEGKLNWPYNRLSYLKDASIYIIGFGQTRNFTPEEHHIIDHLIDLCEQVSISLCVDHESESPVLPQLKGSDAFYFGRSTLKSFAGKNEALCYEAADTVSKQSPALTHLSRCYAKRQSDIYSDRTEDVTRALLPSRVEELSYVAGKIKELVLQDGYRYKDITVAICDSAAYASDLHAVFSDYGLDPFLDKRRKLSETPLMRFVFALVDMSISGGSYLSLMKCAKSGMCHLSYDETDIFENYCLAHGLYKGFKIFDSRFYDVSRDERGPEVWQCVCRAFAPLMDFVGKFNKQKKCDQKAELLNTFLKAYLSVGEEKEADLGHIESLAEEWVQTHDHDAAIALVASYNALAKLLNRLEGPFGNMRITDINFKAMLQAGMDAATSGVIPSYVDQVRITEPQKAFQNTCKVLFLVGATRDRFPFQFRPEGYLRDFERELLEQGLGVSFPRHARDSVYSDFFTAYALLDCPSDKLLMTAVSSEEPSGLFRFIGECLPSSAFLDLPALTLYDPRTYSRRVLSLYLTGVMAGQIQANSTAEEKCVRYAAEKYPEHISTMKTHVPETQIKLPPDMIFKRYGHNMNMSVSQIEKYAACPFQHFAQYLIRLQERDIYKVDSRHRGSLTHEVIERAINEYIEAINKAGDEVEFEKIHKEFQNRDVRQWVQKLFDQTCHDDKTGLCSDPAVYIGIGSKVMDISEKSVRAVLEQINPKTYVPKETEWSYGFGDDKHIEFCLEDMKVTVSLRGMIDRVDLHSDGQYFRVVDYKSSKKNVDYNELYAGLSLQLPTYIYAYSRFHPNLKPGDAGYFHLSAPVYRIHPEQYAQRMDAVSSERAKNYRLTGMDSDVEALMLSAQFATEKIKSHCRRLLEGHYDIQPMYKEKTTRQVCSYCPHTAFCGINPKRPPYKRMPQLPVGRDNGDKKPTAKAQYYQAIAEELKNGENIQCN